MIAAVVPTIRPDTSMKEFVEAWAPLFEKHDVKLITVLDGENPVIRDGNREFSVKDIMEEYSDTIFNFNGGVRNLGFAYVAKHMPAEYVFTFDDDVRPVGDTIQDHLNALNSRVPISWFSTAADYTRGFPYAVRKEAEVVLSHGTWEKNPDWDAPSHLVLGDRTTTYYRGPIPKGIYYPFCSMNVALKYKFLPYIYHAPATLGVVRANDIFCGIASKRIIDEKGWAVVNGMASVVHEKASNVFKSLVAEAVEIGLNETYWQGDESHEYFKIYNEKRRRWEEFIIKKCGVKEENG